MFGGAFSRGGKRKWATGKKAVAICDRCGWKLPYLKLREEMGTKLMVCASCDDGIWNRVTHPLNFPARVSEAIALKNPRPDIIDPLPPFLTDNDGVYILDENGEPIFINQTKD